MAEPLPPTKKDLDPQETREWMEALEEILEASGPARTRYLVRRLIERAQYLRIGLPALIFPAILHPDVGVHVAPQTPVAGDFGVVLGEDVDVVLGLGTGERDARGVARPADVGIREIEDPGAARRHTHVLHM